VTSLEDAVGFIDEGMQMGTPDSKYRGIQGYGYMSILLAEVVQITRPDSQPNVDSHPGDVVNRRLGPPIPHKIHDLRRACWGADL